MIHLSVKKITMDLEICCFSAVHLYTNEVNFDSNVLSQY